MLGKAPKRSGLFAWEPILVSAASFEKRTVPWILWETPNIREKNGRFSKPVNNYIKPTKKRVSIYENPFNRLVLIWKFYPFCLVCLKISPIYLYQWFAGVFPGSAVVSWRNSSNSRAGNFVGKASTKLIMFFVAGLGQWQVRQWLKWRVLKDQTWRKDWEWSILWSFAGLFEDKEYSNKSRTKS